MKLISIAVENFLVFHHKEEFSCLTALNSNAGLKSNLFAAKPGKNILKTCLIIGSNNSGKTTLMEALGLMKDIFRRGSLADLIVPIIKNFNCSADDAVTLTARFLSDDNKVYDYTISFKDTKALAEKLSIDEAVFFERDLSGKADFHKNLEGSLEETVQAIDTEKCLAAFLNNFFKLPALAPLAEFFDKLCLVSNEEKEMTVADKIDFLKNPKKCALLNTIIQSTGVFIRGFSLREKQEVLSDPFIVNALMKDPKSQSVLSRGLDILLPSSAYEKDDGTTVLLPSLFFDSVGTRRYIEIMMHLVNTVMDGLITFIDGFDISINSRLAKALLLLMTSLERGKRTVHPDDALYGTAGFEDSAEGSGDDDLP
jgi:hypothetical protein